MEQKKEESSRRFWTEPRLARAALPFQREKEGETAGVSYVVHGVDEELRAAAVGRARVGHGQRAGLCKPPAPPPPLAQSAE